MTKELALRPLYAQYPNPKPELFGQTRPEPDPKSKSPTRQSLLVTDSCSSVMGLELLELS